MVQLEEHEFTYSNGNAEKKTFYHAAGPKEGPLLIFVHGRLEAKSKWTEETQNQILTIYQAGLELAKNGNHSWKHSPTWAFEPWLLICLVRALLDQVHTIKTTDWMQKGYGKSTARKIKHDYSLEQINLGMVALIDHLGRDKAIWVGE